MQSPGRDLTAVPPNWSQVGYRSVNLIVNSRTRKKQKNLLKIYNNCVSNFRSSKDYWFSTQTTSAVDIKGRRINLGPFVHPES
jgi:hypothetical protein